MIDQEKRLEAATQAIYAAENGIDGDSIGTMIHDNFRIEPTGDDKGLPATMDVCRRAAIAALAAETHWPIIDAAIDVVKGYRNFLVIDNQLAVLARAVDAYLAAAVESHDRKTP